MQLASLHFISQTQLTSLRFNSGVILVGQLLLGSQLSNYVGSFWPQNSTCLSWLDKQPVGSIICVTFGSLVTFNQQQFDELALGLEFRQAIFVCCPIRHNRWSTCWILTCVWNKSKWSWNDCWIGTSREGVRPSFYCMLSKPLWMEFNLGGYKQGSPISMLAFLYRPVP